MYIEHKMRELQPFSECPIWARLEFMRQFSEIYFWDGNPDNPRKISEAVVSGFERYSNDSIYIDFDMEWIDKNDELVTHAYSFPVHKSQS